MYLKHLWITQPIKVNTALHIRTFLLSHNTYIIQSTLEQFVIKRGLFET